MTTTRLDPRAEKRAWRTGLALAASTIVLVVALAVPRAASRALWTDELFSLTTAEEDFGTMLALLREYRAGYFDHPPLYFLLLRFVLLFGNSPLALRSLSMLFVAIGSALWVTELWRREGSLAAAAILIVLLALHPSLAFEATNTRMYCLLFALSSAAHVLIWRLASPKGRDPPYLLAAALALTLGAMVYTSYFGVIFGIGVGMIGVLWTWRPRELGAGHSRAGLALIAACLGGALMTAPWAPVIFRILKVEGGGPAYHLTRTEQVIGTLHDFAGGWVGAAFVLAGWAGLMTWGRDRRRWAVLAVTLVLFPVTLLAWVAPATRTVATRYLIFAIPLVLTGAMTGWLSGVRRFFGTESWKPVLAMSLFLVPVPFYIFEARRTHFAPAPDWWAAAEILERHALPHEVILTGGYLSGEAIVYHLAEPERFTFIHYVLDYGSFALHCREKAVVWFVNVAPLPRENREVLDRHFPYFVEFEGNHGLGKIQIFAKKPFELPWGGSALRREPPPPDEAPNGGNDP